MRQLITIFVLAMFVSMAKAQTATIQGGATYGTVSEALMNANPNDIILISGTITDEITIDKNITLRGTDPASDILQGAASASQTGTAKRVISISSGAFTINIENLGIRHGNVNANGGGIDIDKVTGLVTLKNLIIENNYTSANGGAIGIAGSNVDVIQCTVRNNTAAADGRAIIAAPNNAAGINNVVNIKQSLIDSNIGRNGGGIYINGNVNFGNNYLINVNIENSTISNNDASSASSNSGGGAIFSASRPWTVDTNIGNITLRLVHATLYGNTHDSADKSGIQFGTAKVTNFSAYNSIAVSFTNDVLTKAINFANANTVQVKNCILGGLANPDTTFLDDGSRNNLRGKTASEAGLTGVLTSLGGKTQVIPILEDASVADDFCTAVVGEVTLPTIDQRGATREGTPDAGAHEFGVTLSSKSISENNAFRIYPNPTKGLLYIKSINTLKEVAIYDMTGKNVFRSQKVYDNSLDVSNLNTGLYTLKIEDSQSNVGTQKLVISR